MQITRSLIVTGILLLGLCGAGPAAAEVRPFGGTLRPKDTYASAPPNPVYSVVPITVECRAKLQGKGDFNVLVANEPKHSVTHWEIYSFKDSGVFSAYLPGYEPAEVKSDRDVCDGKWHFLAMTFDGNTVRLYVDGQEAASQRVTKVFRYPDVGPLTFGHIEGLKGDPEAQIDEVRISRVVRKIQGVPDKPFEADGDTIGLWHFDENGSAGFADASPTRNAAKVRNKVSPRTETATGRTRWQDMDLRPFFTCTLGAPFPGRNVTFKGVCVQLGKPAGVHPCEAAVCFDTELMRTSVGWTDGFVQIYPGREGLAQHPDLAGTPQFGTLVGPGWAKPGTDDFTDPRPDKLGPLPRDWAKYKGLYVHGEEVVLSYTVGKTEVLESSGVEAHADKRHFTRTLELAPHDESLAIVVCDVPGAAPLGEVGDAANGQGVRLKVGGDVTAVGIVGAPAGAAWGVMDGSRLLLKLPPSREPGRLKLVLSHGGENEALQAGQFAPPEDLRSMTKGGPANWAQPVVTKGELGKDEDFPYVVDTLTAPDENPWKSFLRFGGLDFLKNGDAAVCSVSGDVWVVSGIDEKLEKLSWRRYAAGLFQPLGLKIVDDKVYVLGRDQITRLHDLNDDGEADFYENFNNDCKVTENGHAYTTNLDADPAGNFYYTKCGDNTEHGGTHLRVSKDGESLDVFATGLRNPNGAGVGPNGEVTAADNQGEWVPASRLDLVKPGGFLGYPPMAKRDPAPPGPGEPIVWMPQNVDNSSGGQVWVAGDKWGPFGGQMLHTSYGAASLLLVLQETVNGKTQGGVVRFPLTFASGIMRGRFRPADGQLYLCGLKGWQTSGARDGALQRVRYTGKPVHLPTKLNVHENGIKLTFASPLDPETAADPDSYSILQWNYHWTGEYGSRQWSVINPQQQGYDTAEIKSARISQDGKAVFLEVPGVGPVMQMLISYNVDGADGREMRGDIYNTVHAVGTPVDLSGFGSGAAGAGE